MNWFERDKFEKILAIIYSNKFNYKNKMGEFKYIDIRDLVNNIRNNTISEMSRKRGLIKLKEIRNVEIIKYKKRTPKQKDLLNLFNNLLDTTLTYKTISSKDESEKENENENAKTLLLSTDENEKQNIDNNANAKNKKASTNTNRATNKTEENKNNLLEYMGDVDDKLFKEYSNNKNFINELYKRILLWNKWRR